MSTQPSPTRPARARQLLDVTAALFAAHPFAVAVIVTGNSAVALLQVLALGSLYPILAEVLQSSPSPGELGEYHRLALRVLGLRTDVGGYVVVFLLISAIAAAVYLAVMTYQARFLRQLEFAIRLEVVQRVLRSQWTMLSALNHGEFVNVVTHEVELYKVLLKNIFGIVAALFQVALFAAAIVYINRVFGLWAAPALVIGYLVFAPLMQRGMRLGRQYTEAYGALTSALINAARAFKNIKASSLEPYLLTYLRPVLAAPGRVYEHQQVLEAVRLKLFELLGIGIMLGLLAFGMQVMQIPIAQMLLMLVFLYRLVPKVSETADYVHRAYTSLPSLAQIEEIQSRCIAEPERSVELREPLQAITLDRVGFRHGDVRIVDDVSVTFRKGEFWAIAGTTGAGKTTILDLIAGILEPSSGEIYYDKHALRDIARPSLHQRVGYLTQDALIFAGSIVDNIQWGHGTVDRSRLEAAIAIAQLDEVVREKTLAHGVTEAGHNLSGGQKQRIAIARVLLGDYDFILMDEPMSALDADTETHFIRALSVLKGKVGLIMVSHRHEYVRDSDYLLRVEGGHAVIEPAGAPGGVRVVH